MAPYTVSSDTLPDAKSTTSFGESVPKRRNTASDFVFRFFCVYFLLIWVPLTAGVIANVPWAFRWNDTIGRWAITHVMGLPEHSAAGVSGLFLPRLAGMIVLAVISVASATVWFAFDHRGAGHPRLFSGLHASVRFMAAAFMLSYGWAKVLPAQFGFDVGLPTLTFDLGDIGPRDLLWSFMSASRMYQVFTGLLEISGAILLMTRRTVLAGALISMAAMTNVLVLDIAYWVPAYFIVAQVLLMTLFILGPFSGQMVSVFVTHREIHNPEMSPLFSTVTASRTAAAVGAVIAVLLVYWTFHQAERVVEARQASRQFPLYGVWDVEETTQNGLPVPLLATDRTVWRRLVFPSRNEAYILWMSGSPSGYGSRIDSAAETIQLRPFMNPKPVSPLNFTYVLKGPDQLLLRSSSEDGVAVFTRLRRADPSEYPTVSFQRRWTW